MFPSPHPTSLFNVLTRHPGNIRKRGKQVQGIASKLCNSCQLCFGQRRSGLLTFTVRILAGIYLPVIKKTSVTYQNAAK